MPVWCKPLSRDTIVAIRDDYAAGELSTTAICARYRIGPDVLCYWVDGGEPEGELHFPPLPRRRKAAHGTRQRRFSGKREAVVRRLWRTAEAQVFEIEQRLIGDLQQPDERERDARTLAVLARTLRDLNEVDKGSANGNTTLNDDEHPQDVEELRRSLAQKLEALLGEEDPELLGETEERRTLNA